MKRELVPLAKPYRNQNVHGLLASVKLDGERAIWVPATRGMTKEDVPFANKPTTWVARDADHVASGLWTRNGNIIHAPSDFLDQLPPFPVDMELYAGPGTFQFLRSAVSTFTPDVDLWRHVEPCILDAVDMARFLSPGLVETRQSSILLTSDAYRWWVSLRQPAVPVSLGFKRRLDWMLAQGITPLEQIQLPTSGFVMAVVDELMDRALAEGCEGLVLRQPTAQYTCARTAELLKHKPALDMDATVTGYVWGKLPDARKSLTGTAVGERLGMMGGLEVQLDSGKRFILSGTGFPYKDCHLVYTATGGCASDQGLLRPGTRVSAAVHNPKYPIGTVVTFKYRSLTTNGIPVEARFQRKRSL